MKIKNYILILLLVALTVGCKNKQDEGVSAVSDSVEYVKPDFQYMQSSFSCKIYDISARGQIRMQSDSIIWISLSKFIELGRLQLTPDSVLLYTKFNNAYYRGTYPDVEKQFEYKLDYLSMQNLIVTAVESDSLKFTLPVRSNVINIDLNLDLTNITYPKKLEFPFKIPASAKSWAPTNI